MAQYAKDQPAGYENHIKNVAIVGAGGQIGSVVVSALLKRGGFNITALTRAGSKNTIPSGVKSAVVDYSDESSLVKALEGQGVFIISLAVNAPPDTQTKLIDAAAKAGVKWVHPNSWGGDYSDPKMAEGLQMMVGPLLKTFEYIESKGMNWIAIACGFWYEFSLAGGTDRYGFDLDNNSQKTAIFYNKGEDKIDTTSFPQVGRAVAAVLSLPILPEDANDKSKTLSSYRNNYVHVNSFKVSQKDMFASLLRVTGTTEADWKISYEPTKERHAKSLEQLQKGDFSAFGRMLYAHGFYPGVLDWQRFGLENEVLGLPQEDIDEFTKLAVEMANNGYFERQYGSLTGSTSKHQDKS